MSEIKLIIIIIIIIIIITMSPETNIFFRLDFLVIVHIKIAKNVYLHTVAMRILLNCLILIVVCTQLSERISCRINQIDVYNVQLNCANVEIVFSDRMIKCKYLFCIVSF